MNKFIPLSVPNLKGNEIKYVTEALEAEWVSTGGGMIDTFEKNIAKFVGMDDAVACQSGTAGLHLALLTCGVQPGEEVIVPTLTFIAAVNPVRYCHAEPVFMDCDDSLCMEPVKLSEFLHCECTFIDGIVTHSSTNKRIRAIVVVHVFGNIADMEKIMDLSKEFNLAVIEDSTEALGSKFISGRYKGMFAGTIGNVGVFSFNGNKIMTTGGGGMVISTNAEQLHKIKYLSTQAKNNTVYFIHHEIGYNYRMTNLQAALGVAQLEQLPTFIETKKRNFQLYKKHLHNYQGLSMLDYSINVDSNSWFYSLLVANEKRDSLIDYLMSCNIQTRPIWGLISEQLPYQQNESYKIEKAKYYYERVVNLPCSTNLSEEDVLKVIQTIKRFFS